MRTVDAEPFKHFTTMSLTHHFQRVMSNNCKILFTVEPLLSAHPGGNGKWQLIEVTFTGTH